MLFFLPRPIRRIIWLGVLLGLLAAGDVWARVWAEGQTEKLAEAQLEQVAGVDVTYRGFPFVGRLVVLGRIDAMEVRFDEAVEQGLTLSQAGFELTGIAIDRMAFLQEREVDLADIDTGSVFAEITQEEVSRVLGATVEFQPGLAVVTVAGQTAQASVTIRDNHLVLVLVTGTELAVPIPASAVLPCAAKGTVLQGRVRVTCTVDTIPSVLVQAASQVAAGLRVAVG